MAKIETVRELNRSVALLTALVAHGVELVCNEMQIKRIDTDTTLGIEHVSEDLRLYLTRKGLVTKSDRHGDGKVRADNYKNTVTKFNLTEPELVKVLSRFIGEAEAQKVADQALSA
jgi:hypothetical protein